MFNSPIKQILFDKLVEIGRLTSDPHESTIQTINDISDSEALKLLKSVGAGPTIQKNMGGMANINEMTGPIGMAGGGDAFEKYFGGTGTGGGFTSSLRNAMRSHPFQTSIFLEMGFDKMFDLLSSLPMMKDGGVVGMKEGGMHPLVEFKEIHEAYILDGGTMGFKEYFDMLQGELDKMAGE